MFTSIICQLIFKQMMMTIMIIITIPMSKYFNETNLFKSVYQSCV